MAPSSTSSIGHAFVLLLLGPQNRLKSLSRLLVMCLYSVTTTCPYAGFFVCFPIALLFYLIIYVFALVNLSLLFGSAVLRSDYSHLYTSSKHCFTLVSTYLLTRLFSGSIRQHPNDGWSLTGLSVEQPSRKWAILWRVLWRTPAALSWTWAALRTGRWRWVSMLHRKI